MANLISTCMGGFGTGRHWMFFQVECILSQKMTETIVAIMGLKGEETWKGPKSWLCPGLDGTKYGLEQLIEAIAVRGLSLQYLGSITQKILKQLGEVPVPSLRLVLAVSRSSKWRWCTFMCSFSTWRLWGKELLDCFPFNFHSIPVYSFFFRDVVI